MKIPDFLIKPNTKIDLAKFDSGNKGGLKSKEDAKVLFLKNIEKMIELQDKLYAMDRYSLLLIFQAMDTAGKDSTIKHVMSGLNPQGTQVFSFKQPSKEELDHGYLWRITKSLPERGRIGIFNRSHYEEVLIVKVHDLIKSQKLPEKLVDNNIWKQRYRQISDFEKYLYENGTVVIKFFLHISKEEQKKRFIKRINNLSKNWKFTDADIEERKFWQDYQKAYEEAISATSKKYAPWYVIPSDKKWFSRLAVSEIIVDTLNNLKLEYPKLSDKQIVQLKKSKEALEAE